MKIVESLFYKQQLQRLETIPHQKDKPDETARSTLACLWRYAQNEPCSVQKSDESTLKELNDKQSQLLIELINRRVEGGEPLAFIVGFQSFMGLELICGSTALIPRKETELLAQLNNKALDEVESTDPLLVDLCTGLGNLAVAAAYHHNTSTVFACDLSADAIELAKKNTIHLKVNDRVTCLEGDLFTPVEHLQGTVDIISCNPPYVSSKQVPNMGSEISEFEPSLAFDGGAFGLDILMKVIENASLYLKPSGFLNIEVGLGQGAFVIRQLKKQTVFRDFECLNDNEDNIRAIQVRYYP